MVNILYPMHANDSEISGQEDRKSLITTAGRDELVNTQ